MSPAFVGFIVVAIVGAAAEMASAFAAARKNRLDMSVGIALGSASQIALFVAPVLVLLELCDRAVADEPAVLARRRGDDVDRRDERVARHQQRALGVVHGRGLADGLCDLRDDALHDAAESRMIVESSRRILDPIDRVSEVLFGLIMVLTFTGSLSVAEAGREDVRTMLIGALGCNIAWGVIDAMLYLMGCLAEKGRGLITLHAVRRATDPAAAQRRIADALPPMVASILEPAELETMRQRLLQLPEPPAAWCPPGQGRMARCAGRVRDRLPLHVPGRDPVHVHAGSRPGPARVQRRSRS